MARSNQVRYSPKIAAIICEEIAGGRSLRSVCREEGMPTFQTVMRWANEDRDGFRARYTLAMDMRAQMLADEMIEIADSVEIGKRTKSKSDGTVEEITGDMVERSKLRVDARKWLLARLSPKRYGDRVALEHTGEGGGPIRTEGEYRITPEDEEFLRRKAASMERMREEIKRGEDAPSTK